MSEGDYKLFADGVSVHDIKQGALGDCYFLSALTVLGSQLTRERFVFINSEEEWRECGAFCISFYDDGKENIIIVDDFIPMLSEGRFPFT